MGEAPKRSGAGASQGVRPTDGCAWLRRAVFVMPLLATACAVGPDYRPPAMAVPPAWHSPLQGGVHAAMPPAAELARWWERLADPLLSRLIGEAVANNLDVKLAQARLREARARYGLAVAERYPALNARAAVNRNRSSDEMSQGKGRAVETWSAQLDASWELDLFGGLRRAQEAAAATLDAEEEALRDTRVSLLAEVALGYVEARGFQARLAIARGSLATQDETWQITRWRHQAGLTTQLDEDQARFNLEQTRAQLPALQQGLAQSKQRLAVLLGRAPGELSELDEPAAIPHLPATVAVGIPADTLRQRPDLRRAERQLAAATAQVGVASAAAYPDVSLSGTLGLQALSGGRLLRSSAGLYALGASVGQVVFDAGRVRHNIEVQNALQQQALLNYQSAVLTALRDVEGALVAYAEEQNRGVALRDAVTAAQGAADLASSQYQAGLVDFQAVLDTQRSLLSLQDQLSQSEAAEVSNLVRLYKALGGGWDAAAAKGG